MVTMVGRLLEIADQLIREGAKSSARRRRAVSTAYYAVFHAIAKSCAGVLLPSIDKSSEVYTRVYRALDHVSLPQAFDARNSPLKNRDSLRKIAELVKRLRDERNRADYSPPKNIFTREEAKELVNQARVAVGEIEHLNDEDRTTLAAWLLFKSRSP
jgi:uncharacterized protein (UPF0332 family)